MSVLIDDYDQDEHFPHDKEENEPLVFKKVTNKPSIFENQNEPKLFEKETDHSSMFKKEAEKHSTFVIP